MKPSVFLFSVANKVIFLITMLAVNSAMASPVDVAFCGSESCDFTVTFTPNGGSTMTGTGMFSILDQDTDTQKKGDVILNTDLNSTTGGAMINPNGNLMWNFGNGNSVIIEDISGNSDPIINFNVSANTGATGATFSFSFDLPISIGGPINAVSFLNYNLSPKDGSTGVAQITPIFPTVLSAFDVDTDAGGLGSLNKGVDTGGTYSINGLGVEVGDDVYLETNTFLGSTDYDLMRVNLNFALSAQDNAGLSGFVEQTPVPVPAAFWLFGSALIGLMFRSNRLA